VYVFFFSASNKILKNDICHQHLFFGIYLFVLYSHKAYRRHRASGCLGYIIKDILKKFQVQTSSNQFKPVPAGSINTSYQARGLSKKLLNQHKVSNKNTKFQTGCLGYIIKPHLLTIKMSSGD